MRSASSAPLILTLQSGVRRVQYRCFAAIILFVGIRSACLAQTNVNLTISAAASLKDALAEIESSYKQSHADIDFSNNFASSGTLATQIDQGAPADVFISAAAKQMDDLEIKGLIAPGSRRILLRNSLVLIAPLDSKLRDFPGLADRAVRMIAVGDPASVPAGQYGRQTLLALHLLDKISAKLVFAKDVRQVLTYVETGNADAGLVYLSDAKSSSKVRVVATAPESLHDAIVYPAAVVKGSHNQAASLKFIEYLASPAASAIFVKHGFTIAAP
ncbi:MAG: molybdate ABC transporter substrate-binding protein [Terracidiphilus sp.]